MTRSLLLRSPAFLAALLIALAACGPSKSTQALLKARSAIHRAEYAEASKKKPYELTLAKEYYVKAKEEAGYSKFELSEKLAKQSLEFAKVAAGEPASTPTPSEETK